MSQEDVFDKNLDLIQPIDEGELPDKIQGWYDTWRDKIHRWVADHSDEAIANFIIVVPDFVALLSGLARDPRVPLTTKAQIMLGLAYILSPVDLIPEFVAGAAGLSDDLAVIAMVMSKLRELDRDLVLSHWRGNGDPFQVADNVQQFMDKHGERILGSGVYGKLRQRFAGPKRGWGLSRWRRKEQNPNKR